MRSIQHPRAEVVIHPDPRALSRALADEFLRVGRGAVTRQGRFTVALAGGSTPRTAYALLAEDEQRGQAGLPWDKVEMFFGDERPVPPDQAESNFRMAHETLLGKVPLPAEHVHRIHGELEPDHAAAEYEAQVRKVLNSSHSLKDIPRFDLILLGMGADGHTASLFPGSRALEERNALVCANWVDKLKTSRITFTFPLLNAAAAVCFAVAGKDKAAVLRQVLANNPTGELYPAQRVQPTAGRLVWLVDEAAAQELG